MGSSRLPGKVLMPLAGRTVLAHVLDRCHAIDGIDVVCCATTPAATDDSVAAEAERCGAVTIRGSETDVLARYHQAAEVLGAGVVMRVTSDCPLLDPGVAAAVLALRAAEGVDYAANNMPPTWPHGLDCEAFTAAALAAAVENTRDPYEREHVTPWIRTNPRVSRANLSGPGGAVADHRWTLDYPEDMAFLRALFEHLPSPPARPGMDEVLEILDRNPDIASINRMRRARN